MWNGLHFVMVLILSTSHDTWCPHSCITVQKVPYPAPLCPQILAGALFRSQLIWIYTVCKGKTYPGSAGQGLKKEFAKVGEFATTLEGIHIPGEANSFLLEWSPFQKGGKSFLLRLLIRSAQNISFCGKLEKIIP